MMRELPDMQRVETSANQVSAFDKDMNICLWNKVLAERYNLSVEQVQDKCLFDFFPQTKDDYRIRCMRDAIANKQVFFFSGIPYASGTQYYTQLIIPVACKKSGACLALNIVRDHCAQKRYTREELLADIYP